MEHDFIRRHLDQRPVSLNDPVYLLLPFISPFLSIGSGVLLSFVFLHPSLLISWSDLFNGYVVIDCYRLISQSQMWECHLFHPPSIFLHWVIRIKPSNPECSEMTAAHKARPYKNKILPTELCESVPIHVKDMFIYLS